MVVHSLSGVRRVAPGTPETDQRGADAEDPFDVAGVHRPARGGADVVALSIEAPLPCVLLPPKQPRLGLLSQLEVELELVLSDLVRFAAGVEVLQGELADHLQHAEAWLGVVLPGLALRVARLFARTHSAGGIVAKQALLDE
jgi:hypothetical protein